MDKPIFLDADGVPLAAGDCAHVKRGAAWVRVWVRCVKESPYGKKLPEALIDNGERWDADGAAKTWTYMEWLNEPKKIRRAAGPTAARDLAAEQRDALRQIATAIGTPANVDPLADLSGLVMMVRGVVEQAESRDIRLAAAEEQTAAAVNEVKAFRIAFNDLARTNTQLREQAESTTAGVESRVADAVAAERMAIGAWARSAAPGARGSRDQIARAIEHGDHIDDDAPPLPSLRMVMLARDEAHKMLTRRADEVERQAARIRELFDENCALRAELDKRTAPHCQHAGDPGHSIDHGVQALEAERDRRIDPVEHARAVMEAYGTSGMNFWRAGNVRRALLARVGPDVLSEVER